MIIGIIAAMRKELDLLLPLLEGQSMAEPVSGYEFFTGSIGRHGIVAMQCGIGKVNAALGAVALIDNFHPDLIVNTGVAGGTDSSMHVLDLLVATGVAYHDVWCGPGTEYGAASGFEVILKPWKGVEDIARDKLPEGGSIKYGLICSGDKFISTEAEVKEIKAHFPQALACDMESAAIAQTCVLRDVRFAILRAISDTPGAEDNISQYENFWNDAPKETFRALTTIIDSL